MSSIEIKDYVSKEASLELKESGSKGSIFN